MGVPGISDGSDNLPPRHIPEYAKRMVRQRCGFGCIFCGAPIYQYDHVREFAQTGDHDPANLTLLCPNHHQEKTAGRLHRDIVVDQNSRPFNRNNPLSVVHDLHFRGRTIKMIVGGTRFLANLHGPEKRFDAVVVTDRPLLSFFVEDGKLLLSLQASDRSGRMVVDVFCSELRHTLQKWDVTFSGSRLVIHEAQREIVFELILHPPDGVEVKRARFNVNGATLLVVPDRVIGPNENWVQGGQVTNYDVGFLVRPRIEYPGKIAAVWH